MRFLILVICPRSCCSTLYGEMLMLKLERHAWSMEDRVEL
jgi:hypothetical protein